MTSDQRLRLLGGDPNDAGAAAALEALDAVRIVVRTGAAVTGPHAVAVAAFVALVARVFGDVSVPDLPLPPNWWGQPTIRTLLASLQVVRPSPATATTRDVVVTFGAADAGDWGIGGGDYTVRVGRGPQPIEPAAHALGVHAAACLAVSQLLLEALAPHGFVGVRLDADYVMNLVDYRTAAAVVQGDAGLPPNAGELLRVAVAGVGSVGMSVLALLGTAIGPRRTGRRLLRPLLLDVIDDDDIDPGRNPYRYPALLGTETGAKVAVVRDRLEHVGLDVTVHNTTVAAWVRAAEAPGFDGLLVSSVDTLDGRAEVADALSRATVSIGVAGLALHAQREGFADGLACPMCDYVSAAPALSQAGSYAQLTGLAVARILTLLQPAQRLTAEDLDVAIGAGRLHPDRRSALVGARLTDLVRQAYAEVALRPAGPAAETFAIAAPQVSWFGGVLGAVEVVKQLTGLPLLDRRVDVDLAGLPPGVVRRIPADPTRRCLCWSGTRRRWHRALYSRAEVA